MDCEKCISNAKSFNTRYNCDSCKDRRLHDFKRKNTELLQENKRLRENNSSDKKHTLSEKSIDFGKAFCLEAHSEETIRYKNHCKEILRRDINCVGWTLRQVIKLEAACADARVQFQSDYDLTKYDKLLVLKDLFNELSSNFCSIKEILDSFIVDHLETKEVS